MLSKVSVRYQLFVFRSIFIQTSCCLVVSPRELYPQVLKKIINITYMTFCSISMSLFHIPSRVCKQKAILCGAGCTDGCRHFIYVIATGIGWTIPHGPTEMAFIYHVIWSLPSCFRRTRLCVIGWTITHGSTRIKRYTEAWNLSPSCFIFLHNTVANMLCRLFDDRKYMDTAILENKKNSLYFLVSTCEHLWPSPSYLVNFANWLIGWVCVNILRSFF